MHPGGVRTAMDLFFFYKVSFEKHPSVRLLPLGALYITKRKWPSIKGDLKLPPMENHSTDPADALILLMH